MSINLLMILQKYKKVIVKKRKSIDMIRKVEVKVIIEIEVEAGVTEEVISIILIGIDIEVIVEAATILIERVREEIIDLGVKKKQ